jgi:hypothetical protein
MRINPATFASNIFQDEEVASIQEAGAFHDVR